MIKEFEPSVKPAYKNPGEDPYLLPLGLNELVDPIHFAPSLINKIQSRSRTGNCHSHIFTLFLQGRRCNSRDFFSDIESAGKIAEYYGY